MPTSSPSPPPAFAPPAATTTPEAAAAPPPPPAPVCRNCATPLGGPFCPACGQRDGAADPSLRELAGDLAEQLFNVDGRVAATVRTLLRHPGRLTLEFLAGRRAPYLSPLRLYLTCSVVYFAVAALTPDAPRTVAARAGSTEPRFEIADGAAITGVDPSDSAGVRREIDRMRRSPSALMRFVGERSEKVMAAGPTALKRRSEEALPKLMFVLVPLFAALTAALFRGRFRYPGHLVFAMHLHAFGFLALVLVELGKAADTLPAIAASTAVAWVSILAYLALAVRRVFGTTAVATAARSVALAVAYFVVLSVGQLVVLLSIIAAL